MRSFVEIDRMTLYEYEMRMRAFRLQQIDKEYEIHLQAWTNWCVQAMKNAGKHKRVPVYKRFQDFFNYDKSIEKELGLFINNQVVEDDPRRKIAIAVKRQRERRKQRG